MELWCEREAADLDAVEAWVARLAEQGGGRVGLAEVVSGLSRRARRTWAPGLGVRRAWRWDRDDAHDQRWWPQGVTGSHDADPRPERRLLLVSAYSKAGHGARLSLLDLPSRRYEHVLLVQARPDGPSPLKAHAGGLVWHGPFVHVAATGQGFWTADLADLVRVPESSREQTFGHALALPVRWRHRFGHAPGVEPLRCSFLSLAQPHQAPGELVVGEYARGRATRRLASLPLGADHLPAVDAQGRTLIEVLGDGPAGMQGAVRLRGRWHTTVSHGTRTPGSVHAGVPGSLRARRWVVPMGPEDLTAWPGETAADDRLYTVTEHPGRRWVVGFRPR